MTLFVVLPFEVKAASQIDQFAALAVCEDIQF